jgi:hypothetical protein
MPLSSRGKHNTSCGTATGHIRECTGCSGSMHGWPGWLNLATSPDQLATRRHELDPKFAKINTNPEKRLNNPDKEVIADWARLDIAEWLQNSDATPTPAGERGTSLPYGHLTEIFHPSYIDQISVLAKSTTKDIWPEIAAELESRTDHIRDVKYELARHAWCDLFIALAIALKGANKAIDAVAEAAKTAICRAILNSSLQRHRPNITSLIVDTIVNKVWRAFKAMMIGHVSLLAIITNEDLMRGLRILALFICPAPEKHREVLENALNPLLDDARNIVKDKTKAYAIRLIEARLINRQRPTLATQHP